MTRRSYRVGASTLSVQFGDLLDSTAQGIVSSDDHYLSMGGGVSRAIAVRAGSALAVDASKWVPLEFGDVAVTSAGALAARFVFHVVTIGPRHGSLDRSGDEVLDGVRKAVARCIQLAATLGLRSIAFPALGAGAAKLDLATVAVGMADAVFEAFETMPRPLAVEIYLQPKRWQAERDYIVFFEELARREAAASRVAAKPESPAETPPRSAGWADEIRSRLLALESQRALIAHELASATGDAVRSDDLAQQLADTTRQLEGAVGDRQPMRLFVSYSHDDDALAKQLVDQLAALRIEGLVTWTDRRIAPGANWDQEIEAALDESDVVLFLVSASFLASDYCVGKEWKRALERQRAGLLTVVPVILKPCLWQALIGELQALPKDGRAVSTFPHTDQALFEVVCALRSLVVGMKVQRHRRTAGRDAGALPRGAGDP
ncbi:MAG: TIR domain-containing protein [Alphaproteobacteria bacterium]|nr:TIR domain-containing protein [Alphaproteobacteria bacterium]